MSYSEDTTCDVLAFATHPDDIEVAMGGTATRLSAQGRSFLIVDLKLFVEALHNPVLVPSKPRALE